MDIQDDCMPYCIFEMQSLCKIVTVITISWHITNDIFQLFSLSVGRISLQDITRILQSHLIFLNTADNSRPVNTYKRDRKFMLITLARFYNDKVFFV